MRIAVRNFPEAKKTALLFDEFDSFFSALIERHSADNGQFALKFSGVVNGAVNLQSVAYSGLVVLNAVPGRCVYAAGAGLKFNIIGEDN